MSTANTPNTKANMGRYTETKAAKTATPPPPAAPASENPAEEQIAVDGFKQVLEMLKIADPAFRESLLRRLAQRDKDLARNLRDDLAGL
jgi:hypothetical protein